MFRFIFQEKEHLIKKYMLLKRFKIPALLLFLSTVVLTETNCQVPEVPGIIISHIPATDQVYIGSPGICILPNGNYVASHDHFGPKSTEFQQAVTDIFESTDKGKTWKKISEINGQFWSNIFLYENDIYIMGTWKHHGNLIIRRSSDYGKTWSSPDDIKTGLLREGEYHTAPMPVVFHNGRIWRAVEYAKSYTTAWGKRYSAMVFSAATGSDLLDGNNWVSTNYLPWDSTYLDGKFNAWLEGNAVVTPEGKLIDFMRVATAEKGKDLAAIIEISDDGLSASFDQTKGFLEFAGGARKFVIRYDEKSKLYWTISNILTSNDLKSDAGSVRNTLVLKSSEDLINWSVNKVLLHHPDSKKHGFQYCDWQFEGNDIIFVSRTAWDDTSGGARNYHDANYMTFHRIKKFRRLFRVEIKEPLVL